MRTTHVSAAASWKSGTRITAPARVGVSISKTRNGCSREIPPAVEDDLADLGHALGGIDPRGIGRDKPGEGHVQVKREAGPQVARHGEDVRS